jgi:hypothetical protein
MMTHAIKRLPVWTAVRLFGIVSRVEIVNAIAMGEHVATHTHWPMVWSRFPHAPMRRNYRTLVFH